MYMSSSDSIKWETASIRHERCTMELLQSLAQQPHLYPVSLRRSSHPDFPIGVRETLEHYWPLDSLQSFSQDHMPIS
ncbi:hypothetical protein EUGRSUZ_B00291 [Eucalyptus grandis]|uniref:Uncharacterized protein n=2 Tax=Eucalyptus grandis TaxID=71139 RepID=A0ACC3LLM9_EUCGR|nr:hypothetical protein EUGRSUZ_B00291 [Eucalyptus grandis]